jgi:uncharacterized membrane protein (DUF2068 family)
MQTAPKNRPTGVTIIGILTIIGGVLMLVSGITLAAIAAVFPLLTSTGDQTTMLQSQIPSSIPLEYLGIASLAVGTILIIIGIVSLIVAYGLFKAKKWAWTANVGLSIISIAMGIVSIATGSVGSIVGIAISGVILYYLYRPHVREYFGKKTQTEAAKV